MTERGGWDCEEWLSGVGDCCMVWRGDDGIVVKCEEGRIGLKLEIVMVIRASFLKYSQFCALSLQIFVSSQAPTDNLFTLGANFNDLFFYS